MATAEGAEITRRFYRLLGIAGQVVVMYTDTASFSIRNLNGAPLTTRPHYQIEDALDEAEQNAKKYKEEFLRRQSTPTETRELFTSDQLRERVRESRKRLTGACDPGGHIVNDRALADLVEDVVNTIGTVESRLCAVERSTAPAMAGEAQPMQLTPPATDECVAAGCRLFSDPMRLRATPTVAPAHATTDELDARFTQYLEAKPAKRMLLLKAEWNETADARLRTLIEGRMLEASITLSEHPEGFNHECLCALCRSYAWFGKTLKRVTLGENTG
jgi:hypothetical protein